MKTRERSQRVSGLLVVIAVTLFFIFSGCANLSYQKKDDAAYDKGKCTQAVE